MTRATVLVIAALACGCAKDLDILSSGVDGSVGVADADRDPGEPLLRYRFDEGSGDRALDSGAAGLDLHLVIGDPGAARWIEGALVLEAPTSLRSDAPPGEFVVACQQRGALSIEAWVRPAEAEVEGTRRIVSLSAGAGARNFTLGQGDLFDAPPASSYTLRLRTTETDQNGLPLLSTGAGFARPALTHLVAIRRSDGTEAIYVDGERAVEGTRNGDFSTWAEDYLLIVGDEFDSDPDTRAWRGELHQIALFARALTAEEIGERYSEGL